MKKLLLMLALCTFCKVENTIFYAQRHPLELPSMQEIDEREKQVIAQCLAYIKFCGKKEGILLSRILLDYEMQTNPYNTVSSIKRYLNEMGFNV